MALTTIKTAAIADDAVTEDKLANAINTERTANTAKTTNATHTGEVTGSGALTIADNAVTLAKMAGGTDGQIITYDASGDPVAVGPGTDGQVLTSTGAGSPPAFEAIPASGKAHNLVINGAMQVAQRGTSASVTGGYLTVDRYETATGGVDEAPTQAQADVASGTTPYTLGFRKCLKVTNGNQTGGAGAGDNIIALRYHAEAQDIANSGWNYTSTSSYVTLSFWIKSSVAQSFQGVLVSSDGTSQIYPFATGSLSADTWTKITKTISGNSNLTFDNNNEKGLTLEIVGYSGSSYATDSATINAWQAKTSGNQFGRASTSTWYTTNDATLEITGVQLEVGDSASDFAIESYAETLRKCQRYYYVLVNGNQQALGDGLFWSASEIGFITRFPVEMRASPDFDQSYGTDYFKAEGGGYSDGISNYWRSQYKSTRGTNHWLPADTSGTTGLSLTIFSNNASAKLAYSAEL